MSQNKVFRLTHLRNALEKVLMHGQQHLQRQKPWEKAASIVGKAERPLKKEGGKLSRKLTKEDGTVTLDSEGLPVCLQCFEALPKEAKAPKAASGGVPDT